MVERIKLYNERGQVEDLEIAKEMAEAENPYHKKILGIFSASKKKIAEGEKKGEDVGESIVDSKNNDLQKKEKEKEIQEMQEQARRGLEKMNREIPGENLRAMLFENIIYGIGYFTDGKKLLTILPIINSFDFSWVNKDNESVVIDAISLVIDGDFRQKENGSARITTENFPKFLRIFADLKIACKSK